MTIAANVKEEKITILTDVPVKSPSQDSLHFERYSDRLAEIIMNSEPRFAIGIFGTWGTGKTSLMKLIEAKLEEERYRDFALGVWFEAWRYDRDKYLALIPFLRQINIKLENVSTSDGKWNFFKRKNKWNIIKKGVEKTLYALSASVDVSAGYGSLASVNLNIKNFMNSLESDGSTMVDGEKIEFHKHPTDHLKLAIRKARKSENGDEKIRIVLFVDELDRCTPDKALEVLESIKAFLDIEGIVYVIAMDSNSIDAIIKKKFGEGSTIKGIDYLQEIVQLPFQVPTWKEGWEVQDIEESIKKYNI
jgi:predicted KAP-like P-loop ATPase